MLGTSFNMGNKYMVKYVDLHIRNCIVFSYTK